MDETPEGSEATSRAGRLWRGLWGFRLEALTLLMLGFTLAVVVWQDALLKRSLVIDPATVGSFVTTTHDDVAQSGRSTARIDPTNPLQWRCTLRAGYDYPYCGYELLFDPEHYAAGRDFSNFTHVTLDIDYDGPDDTMRMHLKNHDPRYSRSGSNETNKFNRAEFPVRQGLQRVQLTLSEFGVADWWLAQNRIPPELSQPQFDNIVSLDVQTGADAPVGDYRFRIERLVLEGRLLTPAELYRALLLCWIAFLAVAVGFRVSRLKKDLAARRLLEETARRRAQEAEAAVAERKLAQMASEESRRQLATLLDNLPGLAYRCKVAAPWTMVFVSEGVEPLTGYAAAEVMAFEEGWGQLIHPDDVAMVEAEVAAAVAAGTMFSVTYRVIGRDGTIHWVLERGSAVHGEDGEPLFLEGFIGDITEQKQAEQSLLAAQAAAERNAARVKEVLENTSDCVFSLNKAWRFTYLNERAREHFNHRDLIGESIMTVLPGIQDSAFAEVFATAMATREPASAEGCLPETGAWYELSVVPNDRELTVFFRDISSRKQSEEKVRWLANHDSLTRLPNRLLFQERLDAFLAAGRQAAPFALLVVDLDEFKRVNDTLGHDAGDQLLCTFASRLREAARPDDVVARLGGDEFAVILKDVATDAQVEAAVDRIYRALRQPHVFAGKLLDCNASIGASLFPRHGAAKAQLMKHADIAVYAAKAAGRGNLKIFQPHMRAELQSRMSMLRLARKAIKEERIFPFYQPKVDLRTGEIVGFEALLRWQHRGRAMQTPDTIAAAFEDLTLAAEISDRMIERVICDMARWREEGVDFGHVAVNAAAAEFRRGDFAGQLLERLGAAGLPAELMQIEVTETVFLGRGADYVERALKDLSAAGVKIALDDFGTGYASLSHLKQFPVDILKIDRSFVADLQSDGAAAIVGAVVNLGKSLGIEIVAEGIERVDQEMHLKSLGCPVGQGYLYSVPVAAGELPGLVRGKRGQRAA